MGGAAYLIEGQLDVRRLGPMPVPRTWLDRLLRRQRQAEPTRVKLGETEMIDVPCKELNALYQDFYSYLRKQLPSPSAASKSIFNYLDIGVFDVHVRGYVNAGETEPEWNIQMGFSGCAGEAEASAQLACHWLGHWHQARHGQLQEAILTPFGFTAKPSNALGDETFWPLKEGGYALYYKSGFFNADDPPAFEVDHAIEYSHPDLAEEVTAQAGELMADGQCRCQLCAPDFELPD